MARRTRIIVGALIAYRFYRWFFLGWWHDDRRPITRR